MNQPKQAPEGREVGKDIPEDSTPINRYDWFKLSRTWVLGAEDRIVKQAEKIQSAVNWFFGLGSSATILSILFKDPKLDKISFALFGLVLLFLFLAYSMAILATTTISKSIDQPGDADNIREVFNQSNTKASFFLVTASVFLFAGMAMVAPALFMSFKKEPAIVAKDVVVFSASYISDPTKDKKGMQVSAIDLSGKTCDSTYLNVRVDTGTTLLTAKPVLYFKHILSHSNFDLQHTLKLPFQLKKAKMFVSVIYRTGKDSILVKSVEAVLQK